VEKDVMVEGVQELSSCHLPREKAGLLPTGRRAQAAKGTAMILTEAAL